MGEGGRKRTSGFLEPAGIDSEGNNSVALGYELVRLAENHPNPKAA